MKWCNLMLVPNPLPVFLKNYLSYTTMTYILTNSNS